jgi:hypothetical protein
LGILTREKPLLLLGEFGPVNTTLASVVQPAGTCDVMEEVVWMGGLQVHPLRMHGIRKMLGVGNDGPPQNK